MLKLFDILNNQLIRINKYRFSKNPFKLLYLRYVYPSIILPHTISKYTNKHLKYFEDDDEPYILMLNKIYINIINKYIEFIVFNNIGEYCINLDWIMNDDGTRFAVINFDIDNSDIISSIHLALYNINNIECVSTLKGASNYKYDIGDLPCSRGIRILSDFTILNCIYKSLQATVYEYVKSIK